VGIGIYSLHSGRQLERRGVHAGGCHSSTGRCGVSSPWLAASMEQLWGPLSAISAILSEGPPPSWMLCLASFCMSEQHID